MALKQVFLNSLRNCKFILRNGKECNFINGMYFTDSADEIDELQYEISQGHPHLSQDADKSKREVDTNADPLKTIKEAAIAEYLANQKVLEANQDETKTTLNDPLPKDPEALKDMGTSMSLQALKDRVTMTNSSSIAGSADSNSAAGSGTATLGK